MSAEDYAADQLITSRGIQSSAVTDATPPGITPRMPRTRDATRLLHLYCQPQAPQSTDLTLHPLWAAHRASTKQHFETQYSYFMHVN